MCFGRAPNIPSPPPAPAISQASPPSPTPTAPEPAEETASRIAEKKRKQLAALKFGIGSTIKTSGEGDTSSLNLLTPILVGALKNKLGA